jgi:hypothetical protein
MSPITTTDVDYFVKNELVPFRERLTDALSKRHPQLFSFINTLFTNQGNKFGLQITENGRVVGEYCLHMNGTRITDVETGKLDSEIHHPLLGVLKPYSIIERDALEKMISDEDNLINDYPHNAIKYLPDVTIKFLH